MQAACYVCLDAEGPRISQGCACRDSAVHIECMVKMCATMKKLALWTTCPVCTINYTGDLHYALARAWLACAADGERGRAACNMAQAHRAMGELGRAERLDRRNLDSADASVRKLAKIGLVSTLLMQPHRLDEAVAVAEKDRHSNMMSMYALQDWPGIERSLAGMRRSAGGAARVDALVIKLHGMALMHQSKFSEAIPSFVEAHALQQRILGPRHADTLRLRMLIGMCELECALLIGRRRMRSRVRRRAAVSAALASLLSTAREIREVLGIQDRTTVVAETTYVRALVRVGRHAEAKNAIMALDAEHTAASSSWAPAIRHEARACGATRGHS
jgi:hypothetical protein